MAPCDRQDATGSAHPEIPSRVLDDEADLVARQALLGRELLQSSTFVEEQACPLSPDPQPSLGVLMKCPHLLAPQALEPGRSVEGSCDDPAEATFGGHPERAGVVDEEGPDAPVDEPVRNAEVPEAARVPAAEAPVRTDPDSPLAVLAEGANEIVHETLFHRVRLGTLCGRV